MKTITLVGGGAFAPRLCEVLADAIETPELELRLTARRPDRLQILANHSAARVAARRPGWSVRGIPSLEDAAANAAIVILLVRVGGLAARAWDEEFPRRFGLAGDEGLGPGGIANAWRTLPELAGIAEVLRRVAPETQVINLMSPLGVTTRLLLDQGLKAFGVCDLPLMTLEAWLARADSPGATVTWRYGGLNHLGWFWDVRLGERDLLKALAETDRPGDSFPIDRPTVAKYRAAPLRYYYDVFDREAARRLGLERSPDRALHLSHLSESLVQRFSQNPGAEMPASTRATPWLDHVVAPIAAAYLGGEKHQGFVDLQNGRQIPELPAEVVVEVAATFSSTGIAPVTPGPLSRPVARFLGRIAVVELLTFRAALERDLRLLEEAIRALPLPIPAAAVEELATLAVQTPPPIPVR